MYRILSIMFIFDFSDGIELYAWSLPDNDVTSIDDEMLAINSPSSCIVSGSVDDE